MSEPSHNMSDAQRANKGLRTALKLVRLQLADDARGMAELWNEQDDTEATVQALATLPTLVLAGYAVKTGTVIDVDRYYEHVARTLTAESN